MGEPSSVSLCAIDTYKAVGLMGIKSALRSITIPHDARSCRPVRVKSIRKTSLLSVFSARIGVKITGLSRVARLRESRWWQWLGQCVGSTTILS